MSSYKYTYFNVRGRGELCRLCFAAGGQEYTDDRIEFSQWPDLKNSIPLKATPVLEVDGVKIPQSFAIVRFLAKRFDLMGKDDVEDALINVVLDCMLDIREMIIKFYFEKDNDLKEKHKEKLLDQTVPTILTYLSEDLYKDKSGFLFGKKMTVADLAIFDTLGWLLRNFENAIDKYPDIKQLMDKVSKEPKIAAWLAKRPDTTL